jgi:hypothetical protein
MHRYLVSGDGCIGYPICIGQNDVFLVGNMEASIVPVHMEASTSTIEASTSTIVQLQLHDFREYWLSNRARSRVYCIGYKIVSNRVQLHDFREYWLSNRARSRVYCIGYPIGQEVGCGNPVTTFATIVLRIIRGYRCTFPLHGVTIRVHVPGRPRNYSIPFVQLLRVSQLSVLIPRVILHV